MHGFQNEDLESASLFLASRLLMTTSGLATTFNELICVSGCISSVSRCLLLLFSCSGSRDAREKGCASRMWAMCAHRLKTAPCVPADESAKCHTCTHKGRKRSNRQSIKDGKREENFRAWQEDYRMYQEVKIRQSSRNKNKIRWQ